MPEQTTSIRPTLWKRLVLAVAVVAAAVAAALSGPAEVLGALLDRVQDLGVLGLLVLGLAYVAACVLFVPGLALTLATGFLAAGLWPDNRLAAVAAGVATVSIASTAGATAAFGLGRTLFRDWASRKMAAQPAFAALDEAVGRHGFKLVLLVRLSPVFPFNLLNYALGVSRVTLRDYVLASWIGMLPATIVYVYVGAGLQDAAALLAGRAEEGAASQVLFVGGLAATVLLFVVVARLARRALADAVAAPPRSDEE